MASLHETPPARRLDTVHKVVRLVAAHPDSWEDAARVAVAEATKSIRDLRHARIVQLDTVLGDEGVVAYRAKLEVTFQLDRRRPGLEADGPAVEVTRYLVVANQTLGSPALLDAVEDRIGTGPAEFHVLVPSSHSQEYISARRATVLGDPLTGFVPADFAPPGQDEKALELADQRLGELLDYMRRAGIEATGEIGAADPLRAIGAVLQRGSFDEIILSTMPAGVSKWLGMDLPSRVRRTFPLPVTHLVDERPTTTV